MQKSKAERELTQTNMSSQAPKTNHLIKKGQGPANCNFDASLERKSARLGTNHTISGNFELTNVEVFDKGVDMKDIQFARILELLMLEKVCLFGCHPDTCTHLPVKGAFAIWISAVYADIFFNATFGTISKCKIPSTDMIGMSLM